MREFNVMAAVAVALLAGGVAVAKDQPAQAKGKKICEIVEDSTSRIGAKRICRIVPDKEQVRAEAPRQAAPAASETIADSGRD